MGMRVLNDAKRTASTRVQLLREKNAFRCRSHFAGKTHRRLPYNNDGHHYLSDLIAGSLLGAAIAAAVTAFVF